MNLFKNSLEGHPKTEKEPKLTDVFPLSHERISQLQKESRPENEHLLIVECRHPDTKYNHQLGQASFKDSDITAKGEQQAEITADNISSILDNQKDIIVIHNTIMARTKNMSEIIRKKLTESGFQILETMEDYDGENNVGRNNVSIHDDFGEPIEQTDFSYSRYFRAMMKKLSEAAEKQNKEPLQAWTQGENVPYLEEIQNVNQRAEKQFKAYLEAEEAYQPETNGKRLVIIQISHIETLNDLWEKTSKGSYTEKKSSGPIKGEMGLFILPTNEKTDSMEISALLPYRDNENYKLGYNKKTASYE